MIFGFCKYFQAQHNECEETFATAHVIGRNVQLTHGLLPTDKTAIVFEQSDEIKFGARFYVDSALGR